MNKVDFPIGVELPLRGGGVAVLYELKNGRWFGRCLRNGAREWIGCNWFESGAHNKDFPGYTHELDILPPKRKAWVVWCKKIPTACPVTGYLFCTEAAARVRAEEIGGTVQEITEP